MSSFSFGANYDTATARDRFLAIARAAMRGELNASGMQVKSGKGAKWTVSIWLRGALSQGPATFGSLHQLYAEIGHMNRKLMNDDNETLSRGGNRYKGNYE